MAKMIFAILVTMIACTSPAVASNCFHSNGTCYAVLGSAYTSSSSSQGNFTYYDSEITGRVERADQGSRAISSVNLPDGAIRLLADGSGLNGANGAGASGQWIDSVKFDLPEGITSITIPIHLHLDGINTATAPGARFGGGLVFQMASYQLSSANQGHYDVFSVTKNCGFEADFTQAICHSGNVSIDYDGEITIWEDVFYQIQFGMSITTSAAIANFQNTAKFSWELPEGVKYISGSGSFLAAQTAGVPEPSTWAMMILGFGAVGGAMRRRRSELAESGDQHGRLF